VIKKATIIITLGILLVGLAEMSIYALKYQVRLQAEAILTEIKPWRPGVTTFSETHGFRTRYKAQKIEVAQVTGAPFGQKYFVDVSSPTLNSIAFRHGSLWSLGIRPSGATVELSYQDQKLNSISYKFYSATFAPSDTPVQLVAAVTEIEEEPVTERPIFHIGYGERTSSFEPKGRERNLGAIIFPTTAPSERNKAFNLDLSCLSSVRGCRLLCKMIPSVWKEAVSRAVADDLALPKEELENLQCQ
jgi:hypothetical protein